jgi:hypothetical protein
VLAAGLAAQVRLDRPRLGLERGGQPLAVMLAVALVVVASAGISDTGLRVFSGRVAPGNQQSPKARMRGG